MIFKTTIAMLVGTTAFAMSAPAVAQQKPTYEQASKIPDQVRATMDSLPRWEKMPAAERMQAARASAALMEASARTFGDDVFGPWSGCVKMVSLHQVLLSNLSMSLQARDSGAPANTNLSLTITRTSFELGDAYRVCRELTEKLYVPRKG